MSIGNPGFLEIDLDIYESCGLADQVMTEISGPEKTAFWEKQ
jgi:hypothetical protein